MKKYLETGQIVNVHGIAGEFKVKPWSNGPEYLTQFKRFYLSPDGEGRLDCERVRVHKGMVLIKALIHRRRRRSCAARLYILIETTPSLKRTNASYRTCWEFWYMTSTAACVSAS